METLDRLDDSEFDVEEILISLEENNNFTEASREEVQQFLNKGTAVYNNKINASASKQKSHLKKMGKLVNGAWNRLINADDKVHQVADQYKHYDPEDRKDAKRQIKYNYDVNAKDLNEELRVNEDRYRHNKAIALNRDDRRIAKRERDLIKGQIKREKRALKKGRNQELRQQNPIAARVNWNKERIRALSPLVQQKKLAEAEYNRVKGRNNVDYGAMNNKKMAVPNPQNKKNPGYSEYQLRAIKNGVKAQQAERMKQQNEAFAKKAQQLGYAKELKKGTLSRKQYYQIKYGDKLKKKKELEQKINDNIDRNFPGQAQQNATNEQKIQQLKNMITWGKNSADQIARVNPKRAMRLRSGVKHNEELLASLTRQS